MNVQASCPVCSGTSSALDVVDFNKSCEEARGRYLGLAGVPVYYFMCANCGFCFAPELMKWGLQEFEDRIYNGDYPLVDPDYLEARPRNNANSLIATFGGHAGEITHLDYGGGAGLLSRLLREAGWKSGSYDPFVDRGTSVESLGRFDLITAFEVFEHVPDVGALMSNLSSLLQANGVILFSTLVSDKYLEPRKRITWWYASPRNGHISLYTRRSLALLAARKGFQFGSFTEGSHVFWRSIPAWAAHVIRTG